MKNFYILFLRILKKVSTTVAVISILSLLSMNATSQNVMNWTGAEDNNGNNQANWDPIMPILKNNLIVDSVVHKVSVYPVFSGAEHDEINFLRMSLDASVLIDKPDTSKFTINLNNTPSGSNTMWSCGRIIINGGRLIIPRGSFRFEAKTDLVHLKGNSYAEIRSIQFGSSKGVGGKIIIQDNAEFRHNDGKYAMGRFSADTANSIMYIYGNGKFTDPGNDVTFYTDQFNKGHIRTTPDRDIKIEFDLVKNMTVITAVSNQTLTALPLTEIRATAGESEAIISANINKGYTSLTNVEWKVSKNSGGPYESFSPTLKGDTIMPVFSYSGTYYVVFSGTKAGETVYSSEVKVVVSPSFLILNLNAKQYIRPGQTGATLTATETLPTTNKEWKYRLEGSDEYMSFDPVVMGNEYTPSFVNTGNYVIACHYKLGGQSYMSKEVDISVSRSAYIIKWLGTYSSNVYDMRNWSPLANIQWNTLDLSGTYTNIPEFTGAINDTIADMGLGVGKKVLINKAPGAKVNIRMGDIYLTGQIIVKSGMFEVQNTIRLDNGNSFVTIQDEGEVFVNKWLIMGNANTASNGGNIYLSGNAMLKLNTTSNDVWRWVAGSDSLSVWHITDNAKITFPGDAFNLYSAKVEEGKILTDEGRKVVVFYNEADSTTTISSRSEASFALTDNTKLIVGTGKPAPELSTKNNEGLVSYEWKFTTTPGANYLPFEPAQIGATCSPKFNEAGNYFIVCEGSDGTNVVTSDEVNVLAVSVVVSPGDTQNLELFATGKPLAVTESVVVDSREWKVSKTSGSGYESIFPPSTGISLTPIFIDENNTFYVVCESIVEGTPVISNEVKFNVGVTNVTELDQNSFKMFPSPAKGAFYVNESSKSYDLSVVDLTGRVVYQKNFENTNGDQRIEFDGRGVYVVMIKTAKSIKAQRIIME